MVANLSGELNICNLRLQSEEQGHFSSGMLRPKKWRHASSNNYVDVEMAALQHFCSTGWSGTLYGAILFQVVLVIRCLTTWDLSDEDLNDACGNMIFLQHTETYDDYLLQNTRKDGLDVERLRGEFVEFFKIGYLPSLRDIAWELTRLPDVQEMLKRQAKKGSLASKSITYKIDEQKSTLRNLGLSEPLLEICWEAILWYTGHVTSRQHRNGVYVGSSVHKFDIVGMLVASRQLTIPIPKHHIVKILNAIYLGAYGDFLVNGSFSPRNRQRADRVDNNEKLSFFCNKLCHGTSNLEDLAEEVMLLQDIILPNLWVDIHKSGGLNAGFPDLLIWNKEEYRMTEVKSPSDRLRHTQTRYISGVVRELDLPYWICNVVD